MDDIKKTTKMQKQINGKTYDVEVEVIHRKHLTGGIELVEESDLDYLDETEDWDAFIEEDGDEEEELLHSCVPESEEESEEFEELSGLDYLNEIEDLDAFIEEEESALFREK